MAGSTEMLAAFRELTTAKQLERSDLLELLRDGIQAALVRKFGPNVQFELSVDEMQGTIKVVAPAHRSSRRSRTRAGRSRSRRPASRTPTSRSATCWRSRSTSPSSAAPRCRPPSSASSSASARASGRGSATSSPTKVGELLSGEVQQIERGKLVIMLNKFREAEAIIPYREQNHREHFHQGEPIRAVLKRVEETPKGPRLILSPRRSAVREGAVQARGARDPAEDRRDPRHRARGGQPHQDRRLLARRLDRSGRRVRRPQGLARAGGRQRARRRAHRHRAVVARSRSGSPSWRSRRPAWPACSAIPRPRRFRRSWTRTSSRSPSAATARTSGSRPSSPAGRSTSTPAASGWSAAARGRCSRRCRPRRRRSPRCRSASSRASRPSSRRILESAGYRMLNDILDLEREDIAKIPGHDAGDAEQLLGVPRRADRRGRRRGSSRRAG